MYANQKTILKNYCIFSRTKQYSSDASDVNDEEYHFIKEINKQDEHVKLKSV